MLKKIIRNKKVNLILTLVIAIEIFLFSSIKTTAGESSGFNLAFLYHFGIFFLFSFFLFNVFYDKNKSNKKTIVLVLLISLIYAVSDEFHQLFVPGRFGDIKDVLTDFAGSITAVIFNSKIFSKL